MTPRRILVGALVGSVLMASACGGSSGAATTAPPETAAAPPTTYVIVGTGLWSGALEAVGGSSGTISFTVRETAASTRETLAGGQVVVYDYVVEDLEIVLDLVGHPCPSGDLTGERRAAVAEAIPVDAGSRFLAETDEVAIEGSTWRGAAGNVTVMLGDGCAYGPVAWSATSP